MYENTLPANEVSNVVQQEAASGDKVGLLTKDRILMIKCPHEELILPIVVLFIIIITTCQTESPPPVGSTSTVSAGKHPRVTM